MKNILTLLLLLMTLCLHAQDSTYRKYYATGALRLNYLPRMLPVGLEGSLNYGLSRKIYLGLNVGMDMATTKGPIGLGNVGYAMPPGAKGRLSFYSIGLDVQYKLQAQENSFVINCTGGIEVMEAGYVKKDMGSTPRKTVQTTSSLVLIRPGFRYYFRDRMGLGLQYTLLVGSPQYGAMKGLQRAQLVVALKTNQQRPRSMVTM